MTLAAVGAQLPFSIRATSAVLEVSLGQMIDKVTHAWVDACIVGDGGQYQLAVAESIGNSLCSVCILPDRRSLLFPPLLSAHWQVAQQLLLYVRRQMRRR